MNTASETTPTSTAAASPGLVKTWLPILLFSLLWLDLVRLLSGNWEAREQYAYGWFVPFLALALLWRRWPDRPFPLRHSRGKGQGEMSPSSFRLQFSTLAVLLCLLLLPLRVIFEINTDWPLVAWTYTPVAVALTLYAFYLAGGWPWVRHFAFPVCFILVALVWPYRIEKGLTQNLMQTVATLTVEIIGWFGVPAVQRGNLIEVTTGVVGVDEACSGIRSFQSTLMAALFLGELYRLRWPLRLGLLIGGVIVSFGLNVVRTLFLTWQADAHGLSAIDKYHDSAGMSIFLISFACLWGLAVLIRSKSNPAASATTDHRSRTMDSTPESHNSQVSTLNTPTGRYLMVTGCWVLVCLATTEAWYRVHANPKAGVFHWTAAMPKGNPTYEDVTLPPRTLSLLSFDQGSSGKWIDNGVEWNVHFFRWQPRSVQSVIYSRAHRPEVCMPASGLRQIGSSELVTFDVGNLKLPFRKYTFQAEGRSLHVFFCQWEDGSENQSGMHASKQSDRLQSVLNGRRRVGQQTLQLILTGYETLETAEQAVRQRLPGLIAIESSATPSRPAPAAFAR